MNVRLVLFYVGSMEFTDRKCSVGAQEFCKPRCEVQFSICLFVFLFLCVCLFVW